MKVKSESEVAQSCPTLSDPMDGSPPGSSVHGIFQARVLEWGAIAFSAPGAEEVFNNYLVKELSYHSRLCNPHSVPSALWSGAQKCLWNRKGWI